MPDPVLIFDTGVATAPRRSAYAERRAERLAALEGIRRVQPDLATSAAATRAMVAEAGLPAPLDRRARHVVSETQRVRAVVAVLEAGGAIPGDLLLAFH